MRIGTVDINKLRGLADKAMGLGKEWFGTVTGNDRMVDAGEAQQEKATQKLRALRKELEAQAREAEAEVQEGRQRAAQKAKETANN